MTLTEEQRREVDDADTIAVRTWMELAAGAHPVRESFARIVARLATTMREREELREKDIQANRRGWMLYEALRAAVGRPVGDGETACVTDELPALVTELREEFAAIDRDRVTWRARANSAELQLSHRIALRRELEDLLGVDPNAASEEQLAAGVAAVRALQQDAARWERLRTIASAHMAHRADEDSSDLYLIRVEGWCEEGGDAGFMVQIAGFPKSWGHRLHEASTLDEAIDIARQEIAET